jgi:hypothetical protein
MLGIVESTWAKDGGSRYVSLRTQWGTLIGLWDGPPPVAAASADVELDFEPERIEESSEGAFCVASPAPGRILLCGVSELCSNGVVDIRLGTSLVQVEATRPIPAGRWLTVQGRDLKMYDTNM